MSISKFGDNLTDLFVGLTIAQSDENPKTSKILRPINEKLAIYTSKPSANLKRFADGLRNRRLSTIISARDYSQLKDAVRAAEDEELGQPSSSNNIFNATQRRVHSSIQFTTEKEKDGMLPFLDVLVSRGTDSRLSHTVYRKPTHTDRYLRADSHHHPSYLASVPRTLINRALNLCDPQYIDAEFDHLRQVLENNGYNWRQCTRNGELIK
ncbi:hypothetical protein HF086_009984 [Spodoptera exigua]|uniref:Helix-turn-helix domain-containing protein n=1 Tax=Spodoptera exigua TaxID=7107 RepID=A0A922MS00_SPOEX|nr:hypothetical protein HF086_009984 [Spodoptera exigua]